MSQKNIQLSFFIILTLSLLAVSFFIFKPYLGIIFISAVLTVIFHPLYEKFLGWFKDRKSLSAGATLVVIVFAIILPVIFLSTIIFTEAVDLYNSLVFGGGFQKVVVSVDALYSRVFGQFFPADTSIGLNLNTYFESALSWIIGNFNSIFSVVFQGFLGFILILITVYYLLINGRSIKKNIVEWSPLPDQHDEELIKTLKSSVDAVIRGRFLVSIAQGFFLAIGFMIFGVPHPVLWGFVGAIASLVPILGTSLITIPAAGYMFLVGSTGAGIGVLIWGALAVGLIDDVLSFLILKRGIKIHPLFVLFSIFGGIELFGLIGFLAGPVIVSAFLAILKIYPFIMARKTENIEISNEQVL